MFTAAFSIKLSQNGLVHPFECVDGIAVAALRKMNFKLTVNFALEVLVLAVLGLEPGAAPRPQPGAYAARYAA